jgi:hypothetical protein
MRWLRVCLGEGMRIHQGRIARSIAANKLSTTLLSAKRLLSQTINRVECHRPKLGMQGAVWKMM